MKEPMLLTHDIMNRGMERLLERDENGEQRTHEAVCKRSICSENLGYREYLDNNLAPVLIRLLEQNQDGQARAAIVQKMLTTAFQIGASVALLGVQDEWQDLQERSAALSTIDD